MFLSFSGDIDFIESRYLKMARNIENSMKVCLTTFSWVFWVLLLLTTMFIDWIIKHFSEVLEVAKTNDIQIFDNKHILLIKVIKNLSKVFMQQYNYPKLIWMKQNVSFACSNYRSNWQLTDNFCLHLSEPNRSKLRRKKKNCELNRDHWTAMHRNFGESLHLYPLHYRRITPLNCAALSYPPISSTTFPYLPSPRISSLPLPSLPYPTTLISHHSLPSPYPLTRHTLP